MPDPISDSRSRPPISRLGTSAFHPAAKVFRRVAALPYRGAEIYRAKCASCHGANGAGKPADALAGGMGSLSSATPLKTVGSYWPYATTLFDYVRRAMPYDRPLSLSDDEVYAVSAYILALNGIIREHAAMDAKSLPQVEMPNRNGFVCYWPLPQH
jgi:cytochrome c